MGSPPEELFQKFIKNSAHSNEFKFEYQKGIGIQRYLNHVSSKTVDLINKMLVYDPDKRLTAKQCLNHECFKDLVEQDLKTTKMSQINFYQNSILMKSLNDSTSFIKMDDSIQYNNNNKNNYQNNNNQTNQNNNNSHSHSKTLKTKKENNITTNLSVIGNGMIKNANNNNNNYNYNKFLPVIKLNHINEDSKGEDSFNNSMSKKHQDSYLRLPKISQKNKIFGGIGNINLMNSNEFKKIKHNISNHSIDNGISSAFTQYEKKQAINIRKRINDVKKNYVSPYSKKELRTIIIKIL